MIRHMIIVALLLLLIVLSQPINGGWLSLRQVRFLRFTKSTSLTTVTKQTMIATARTISATSTPSSAFTIYQKQALKQTNKYRAYHCAPDIILNATLNAIAQAYAIKLATNRTLIHSGNGYGENLWTISSSVAIDITTQNGSTPVDSWYNEVRRYNWASPVFTSSTGHFTQVVWKSSRQFGIGISCTSDKKGCYVVANYWPPGNYLGQFASNVKKGPSPCAS